MLGLIPFSARLLAGRTILGHSFERSLGTHELAAPCVTHLFFRVNRIWYVRAHPGMIPGMLAAKQRGADYTWHVVYEPCHAVTDQIDSVKIH